MDRNPIRTMVWLVLGLILVLAAGCPSRPKGKVLARVNNDYMTKEEFELMVPEGFSVDQQNLPLILDKWVSNTLMYQEAVRRGLDKKPEVRQALKRLERDYLVNQLLEELTGAVSVSQAEMMQYFNAHRDEFCYEVKIMRIVLPDSLEAEKTLAEIRAGADFKKLAKERSQDILLEGGQESRYFARGVGDPRMGGDPEIEETIFSLAPGEVSDVLSSQEGYQIIKLVDKKKVKAEVTLAEVKDYIEAVLSYRKNQDVVDRMLSALREKAKVELRPDAYFEN
ncbi:MAG: peptidyl-prolyl cis-trans isomerase [candidate division WOR-3 bacterium]